MRNFKIRIRDLLPIDLEMHDRVVHTGWDSGDWGTYFYQEFYYPSWVTFRLLYLGNNRA